jgi:uncharacterized protein HemX
MNNVKKFLFAVILFWILGFLYVFFASGNRESSSKHRTINENEANQLDASVDYFDNNELSDKFNRNFKQLVDQLHKLEVRNEKNEQTIKQLQKNAKLLLKNNPVSPIEENECK